jgi:hypothetical protein
MLCMFWYSICSGVERGAPDSGRRLPRHAVHASAFWPRARLAYAKCLAARCKRFTRWYQGFRCKRFTRWYQCFRHDSHKANKQELARQQPIAKKGALWEELVSW